MYARTRENGGTILYSAPEIVGTTKRGRSREALFAADIYSLGVLLYHLITSRLPHDTLSQVARHTPFARPREINTSVCPALEEVTLRCLAVDPQYRYGSVEELITAAEQARRAQLDYVPERTISAMREPTIDWSSDFVRLLDESQYAKAENIARTEFELTGDLHAFLMMISAASKHGRFFDCKRDFQSHPEALQQPSMVRRDLRDLALKCFLETRDIDSASALLDEIVADEGENPNILLQKASILGLQAKYEESSQILLQLNRDFPGRPAILKRLITVFEQLRGIGKASAFLKAYEKIVTIDTWAQKKRERFIAIGSH
jgi:serine/threonine-protein kinase